VSDDENFGLQSQVLELREKVQVMEQKHQVSHRWHKSDYEFQRHWTSLDRKRRVDILTRLQNCARERHFLLEIKKRHAVGQALTQRIDRQITKCSNLIKKSVRLYNSVHAELNIAANATAWSWLPACVSDKDCFNASSTVFNSLQLYNTPSQADTRCSVPFWLRCRVVESYIRRARASEEMVTSKREMTAVYSYYTDMCSRLSSLCDIFRDKESGKQCLLLSKLRTAEHHCRELNRLFSPYVELDGIVQHIADYEPENAKIVTHSMDSLSECSNSDSESAE
jgi:hypothetical protein